VFGAWGWGLRRYAWVVVLFIVAAGALLPWLQSRAGDTYEARALVGPQTKITLPNLDPLPRMAETQFNDGQVADAVRQELGLQPTASVIPTRTDLIAPQDNPIFTILGRAGNPTAAANIANVAASAFAVEMNKFSQQEPGQPPPVGSFQVTTVAQPPTNPLPHLAGGKWAVIFGLLAGAIAGVGVVALIVVIRRPVIDSGTAVDATDMPVLGRISMQRNSQGGDDVKGVAALCRRLMASDPDQVFVVGPAGAAESRRVLAASIASVLERSRRTRLLSDSDEQLGNDGSHDGDSEQPELVVVAGPSPAQIANRSSGAIILLLVPAGISTRSLRDTAESYDDGGVSGIVFTRVTRRAWPRRRRTTATTHPHAEPDDDTRSDGPASPDSKVLS
jgi:hypothetical protein